jgi:hypothetical protein
MISVADTKPPSGAIPKDSNPEPTLQTAAFVPQHVRDRALTDARLEPSLTLERTDFPQSIDIDGDTMPAGLIARLEHALDRMDADLEEQRRRITDAKARLSGYEPRLGEAFPLQGELDAKLAQLVDIEADLAGTEGVTDEKQWAAAEV